MSDLYWFNPFYSYSTPEPILREAFAWESNGIFTALDSAAESAGIELPWEDEDAETLDTAYFANHSGSKFCSPLVKSFLKTDSLVDENGKLNEAATLKIAKLLLRKYYTNWTALWRTNVASYNPIYNYDMTENRSLRKADSEAVKSERNSTDSNEYSGSNQDQDYRFGINTVIDNPQPSDRTDSSNSSTSATTTESSGSRNKVGAGEEEEEIHRAGNIGVTTTQKLLQEERELWLWNFFDQVFNDIDRELALMFHDSCRV